MRELLIGHLAQGKRLEELRHTPAEKEPNSMSFDNAVTEINARPRNRVLLIFLTGLSR